MCGIVGLFGPAALAEPPELRRMVAALVHRGPDASGEWCDPDAMIALGHRRLSVIDTSEGGAQPMGSRSGRFVLSYNGELYNFHEIAVRLEADGVRLKSSSDTEVFVEAVDRYGLDRTLEMIDGMFAFGLWDRDKRELTLGRDRFGEKPLVVGGLASGSVGSDGPSIAFASELGALRAHRGFDREIDPNAVALYLRYKVVPAPFTIHRYARKIRPGTYEVFDRSSTWDQPARAVQWYSPAAVAAQAVLSPFAGSVVEAVEQADSLISRSVRSRMVADVALGAFLSGGIDSRVIAALMAMHSTSRPQTFTIGSDDADYDESSLAAASADALGCDHHHLTVTADDALRELPTLHSIADEPFGDSSLLPTMLVSRLAVGSVTVSLSGDAGDEIFGGYERYRWIPRIDRVARPVPSIVWRGVASAVDRVPLAVWRAASRGSDGQPRLRRLGQKVTKAVTAAAVPSSFERECRVLEHWPMADQLVIGAGSTGAGFTGAGGGEWAQQTGWRLDASVADAGTRMAVRDLVGYLPDDILAKVDRAAMSVSLETRVPFLDPAIVQFGFSLPPDLRFREGRSKWVLREVLGRHLPKALVDAPKAGFGLPIDGWLRGSLHDWAAEMLSPSSLATCGLRSESIQRVWRAHVDGRTDAGSELWTVLMLVQWLNANG